jgi:hypothetical protein
MIIDTSLVFSNQQAVTNSAPSTNAIDLGATGTPFAATIPLVRDIGQGEPIDIAVSVSQTFTGLTSMQVSVQTSPDSVNWTTVDSGSVVPAASLATGYLFKVPKIVQAANSRYLQLYYTVNGTATAGAINASIVASRQSNINCGGV